MHKKKKHRGKDQKSSPGHHVRIWIVGDEGTFLGYGRIVLLERIREHGSISKAAKSMSMSYRHAWELVDSMNSQSPKPLVESATGGRNGGGRLSFSGSFIMIFKHISSCSKKRPAISGDRLRKGRG